MPGLDRVQLSVTASLAADSAWRSPVPEVAVGRRGCCSRRPADRALEHAATLHVAAARRRAAHNTKARTSHQVVLSALFAERLANCRCQAAAAELHERVAAPLICDHRLKRHGVHSLTAVLGRARWVATGRAVKFTAGVGQPECARRLR